MISGRSDSRRRGFTLIEVMVALAIIAVSLTGIAVTMGGMLDNAVTLRERTYASWIAQNKIVEIRAAGFLPDTGTSSGDVDYAGQEWSWEADVSETGIDDFLRIDVTVSRVDGEGPVRTVTGFIGEPVIPGQANRTWLIGIGGAAGPRNPGQGATN
ncbi:MAG: type II secretion system minor pseudopilin GspI [Woeseiaceae bacterium]|nr:type II secretion system minor pseudopilin GspI [Woeseiaceae bacterium]